MTPACRDWTERFLDRMTQSLDWARRSFQGRTGQASRIRCLEIVVADLRDRLDRAGPPPVTAAASAPPLAGGRRERLLASAIVAERLGNAEAAAIYRRKAEEADDGPSFRERMAKAAAELSAPDAIVPFAAGPQMDMFTA